MFYIVVLLILFIPTYWLWTRNFDYWKLRGIPGPTPSLLYGNTKSFWWRSKDSYCLEVEQIFRRFQQSGSPVVGYFAGRKPHLLAMDAATVKEIMIKNFASFADNELSDMMSVASDPVIARNPFFAKSSEWKDLRKDIAVAFTHIRVKSYYPIIQSVCQKLRTYLDKQCSMSSVVDIDETAGRYTTEVVSDVIFGVSANALTERPSEIFQMGKNFIGQLGKLTSFFIWTGFLPVMKRVYKFQIIEHQESVFFQHVLEQSLEVRRTTEPRHDFLQFQLNLREKRGIGIEGLTANAMTVYLDGYDTTSIAIAKTLQELSKNQEIQEKLRKEIRETAEIQGGELSFEALMSMEYLDAVVNESLRLHPPITLLVKQCTKDVSLNHPDGLNPISITKGTPVMIHIAAIHRDSRNYVEPMLFNPDRFLRCDAKKLSEEGMLLTFGCGPRICLGMKFAVAQVKACICEIIKNYKLTPCVDVENVELIPSHFFNYPSQAIILNVERI